MFLVQAFIVTEFKRGSTNRTTMCGGSLIKNNMILSAAHCFVKDTEEGYPMKIVKVTVRLGEHNIETPSLIVKETIIQLSKYHIELHDNYTGKPEHINDIAKLHLDDPIDFSSHPEIHPICLPENPGKDYDGEDAVVTGWGMVNRTNKAEVLQGIALTIVNRTYCNHRLTTFFREHSDLRGVGKLRKPNENHICAQGPEDAEVAVRACSGAFLISS